MQDNYTKLANYAGIEGTIENVEDLLTNEALSKICSSNTAVDYMITQCTGDFMCELLSRDESIGYLTQDVKNKMKKNANWNKFITIYEKEDLF